MAFNNNYIKELNEIIKLIKEKKFEGENNALEKFSLYLDTIQAIGSFDSTKWRQDWRKLIWQLGEEFKALNPQKFLGIIDEKLNSPAIANKEVIEFIRSEIIFNYLPSEECKKIVQASVQAFPLNPEFRHTLGHFFKNEEEFINAINEYKLALKIEKNNNPYVRSLFIAESQYLNDLISKSEYRTGQNYLDNLFQEKFYLDKDPIYHNSFIDFNCRFQDHVLLENKIKNLETEFKKKMNDELDSERKRIIEVVGFFSGIVAFILSTVSIGKNFSFIEAICFIIGLGLVLILFAISMSILFNTNKKTYLKDKKFWILIVGILLLFFYLIFINSFAKLWLLIK